MPDLQKTKFIFITGGVMSGLGKGITSGSIAKLLKKAGFNVTCAKIDPYLNVDAGTMNPLIHGEVFVTDDGGETDMDIGTYERFLNQNLTIKHNITTGQIYLEVIEKERRGAYLGRCVQIIPNITDLIKKRLKKLSEISNADILLVESGGTVGDIEGLPFLESFRQMRIQEGPSNTLFIHVTLAPILDSVGEQKTKPTQHSVQELRRIGIQPDILVVRSPLPLSKDAKEKIGLFANVPVNNVISNPDASSIYAVPQTLYSEGILRVICNYLNLNNRNIVWKSWLDIVKSFTESSKEIRIAMVGKYISLADSYVSINEALNHAGALKGFKIRVDWVDSEIFEKEPESNLLSEYNGVLIPGGFGSRGSEGKIIAANYARIKKIPYLGICFGFQLAIVSFARYGCKLEMANSTEIDPNTPHPVIDLLPEQGNIKNVGGSMRLGGIDLDIEEGTIAYKIYKKKLIRERHRHRYEFNQKYKKIFEQNGMVFSGSSDDGKRIEICEIPSHPFNISVQYHPEFISRPSTPEPLFTQFISSAINVQL